MRTPITKTEYAFIPAPEDVRVWYSYSIGQPQNNTTKREKNAPLERTLAWLNAIKTSMFILISILFVAAVGAFLYVELTRSRLLIEDIYVSEPAAKLGFYPETIRRQLVEALETRKYEADSKYTDTVPLDDAQLEPITLRFPDSTALEITVPEINVTLRSLSYFLAELFGLRQTVVSGYLSCPSSQCNPNNTSMILRVSDKKTSYLKVNSPNNVSAYDHVAMSIFKETRPIVFALLNYDSDREAAKAAALPVAAGRSGDKSAALNLLGSIAMQERKYDEAVGYFERAVRTDGNIASYHSNLGTALLAAGDAEGADHAFRAALAIDPHNAWTLTNLASAQLKEEEVSEAEATLRHALDQRPDYQWAHVLLADALDRNCGTPEACQPALEEAEEAIAINPNYAYAYAQRGSTLFKIGKGDAAIESYRKAIEIRPDYAWARTGLAQALREKGEATQASDLLREVNKDAPDYAWAHVLLAEILLDTCGQTGDCQEALEAAEAAARLEPGNDWAEKLRQRAVSANKT
jgi:tetratricopeptide (TPR) repeat protein